MKRTVVGAMATGPSDDRPLRADYVDAMTSHDAGDGHEPIELAEGAEHRHDVAVRRYEVPEMQKWQAAKPAVPDHDLDDELVVRFMYAHEQRGSSSVETLQHALSVASKRPTRKTLERMRAVANEVGRRDDGGEAIAKVFTQDVVDDLVERNHRR